MKIAYYYPPQNIVEKDLLFCKYTGYEFLHHRCDASVDLIYAGDLYGNLCYYNFQPDQHNKH